MMPLKFLASAERCRLYLHCQPPEWWQISLAIVRALAGLFIRGDYAPNFLATFLVSSYRAPRKNQRVAGRNFNCSCSINHARIIIASHAHAHWSKTFPIFFFFFFYFYFGCCLAANFSAELNRNTQKTSRSIVRRYYYYYYYYAYYYHCCCYNDNGPLLLSLLLALLAMAMVEHFLSSWHKSLLPAFAVQ